MSTYQTTQVTTFNYTGAVQQFTVPVGCSQVKIECYGAQGGYITGGTGGKGGYITGTLDTRLYPTVKTLYVYVGQAGATTVKGPASWNGGAATSSGSTTGCPGGGASDVRFTTGAWNDSTSLASRIVVAGAGGGCDDSGTTVANAGGDGGGLTGVTGASTGGVAGGHGGTQTAGGAGGIGGTYGNGSSGTLGAGGGPTSYGGGGGGGYYGGGGGTGNSGNPDGSGGGGSSYVTGLTGCTNHSSGILLTSCSTTAAQNTGNGKIVITAIFNYLFLMEQSNNLYCTDGTLLSKVDVTPYTVDKFMSGQMSNLNNVNYNVIQKFNDGKYQVAMYKK